jgi:ABC-type transporter Mla MlaB component
MGEPTLRITFEQPDQSEEATVITLEGRVAGPWAAELGRVWVERAPHLAQNKLSIDLSNVMYADADGIQVLQDIYAQAAPELVAPTPWARHLASQIAVKPSVAFNQDIFNKELGYAGNE